ncbi:presenilin-like protein At1g08700 isoform X2 [Magnolia sinica]|uniref:presenilin-like protein At1g08700 isoform X2 n=1 Tax=Magnolia sinica TaxID=86752 RepID=UPI0026597065|nr:presenilin-like protein At1g08700 isoform X2 [Magnolia sinica]
MEPSILSSVGAELLPIISPVSLCMLLVVALISAVHPPSAGPTSAPIRTAATLIYLESPSDSLSQKLQGALLNAAAFIALISLVTFLLVLLYYYNFTSFLKHYMRFSAFFVFASMGGAIFLSVIRRFSFPIDAITCFLLLFNFTAVGVLSVFSTGFPIIVRQGYMVSLGIIVAAWFTKLPEWTTWVLLVALAVYDLVAVLAPGGPLKILVELASSREEELPALIYEARPTVSRSVGRSRGSSSGVGAELFPLSGIVVGGSPGPSHTVGGGEPSSGWQPGLLIRGASEIVSVELQPMPRTNVGDRNHSDYSAVKIEDDETWPLVPSSSNVDNADGRRLARAEDSDHSINEESMTGTIEDEVAPLIATADDGGVEMTRGIKLGLGDFVFYSVLVGRAAMYDLMTVYACYLAIISGLGCTLILLSVCRRALPALPISIALGVLFYFLTRLMMEPFVVGASTNLFDKQKCMGHTLDLSHIHYICSFKKVRWK